MARFALSDDRMYTVDYSKLKVFNTAIPEKPVYIKELSASLTAEYDVYTDASGKIMSAKIRKRSGDAYWDDAALNAILKTERLPFDENGRVPSPMTISLRPRD